MSDFTNKDVEYLIQKANISYEDAFNLLTHCGGDMAKALEYLQSQGYSVGGGAKQETPVTAGGAWRALQVLYGFRVKIRKGEVTVLNLSIVTAVLGLIISWVAVLVGVALAFLLGYSFSFDLHDPEFTGEALRETVMRRINSFRRKTVQP